MPDCASVIRIAALASRYGAVGVCCALLNVGIVWMGTEGLRLPYPIAVLLTCPITIPISYTLHRRVSFAVHRAGTLREFARFALAQLSQFAMGFALMAVVVEYVHWRPWIAMAVVSAAMMAYGFTVSSRWVFNVLGARAGYRTQPLARSTTGATRLPSGADTRPLRLLQVSAFFAGHGGGIEVVAGQLARRLSRSGVHVTWMAGGPTAERPDEMVSEQLIVDHAVSIDLLERRIGLPAPVWSVGSLRRLWRHVGVCDVVHVHDYLYMPTLCAVLFAGLRRRPVVLTQHVGDIVYESRAARILLRALNRTVGRLVLSSVAQVVFVGRPVKTFFEHFVRFRRPPLLVPNGVDREVYWPSLDRGDVAAERTIQVLFVGRFVARKGLALVRECIGQPGIHWSFAGRGPMSPQQWNVDPSSLTLLGTLSPDRVADEMRAADLLVLPSNGEGFPLVVQEALSCGTPVLVSQEVADAFPVIDPRCVWAVDLADERPELRLAAVLERLSRDRAALSDARPAAVALASQWSWERCVDTYLTIYRLT